MVHTAKCTMTEKFHDRLKVQIHGLIMKMYDLTEHFPKSELYGTVSQLRRAIVSIMLNYVEGYGRITPKVKNNFYEISYGSARECKYLLYLATERNWISRAEYEVAYQQLEEVCKMLWSIMDKNEL